MEAQAPNKNKINEGEFRPDYALQYRPLDALDHFYPDEDEKCVVIRIAAEDEKTGQRNLIGQTDIRRIEVRHGWDKSKREVSNNPQKMLKVRFGMAKLIIKEIKGFEESLSELIEEDRELFEDTYEHYNDLLKCEEIDEPELKGMRPFKATVRYVSQLKQGELRKILTPRGNYDPGTLPGRESENDKKYTYALARAAIKRFEGLYDDKGNEITFDGDAEHPNWDVLYEFVERNSQLFDDLSKLGQELRSQTRKQKKVVETSPY